MQHDFPKYSAQSRPHESQNRHALEKVKSSYSLNRTRPIPERTTGQEDTLYFLHIITKPIEVIDVYEQGLVLLATGFYPKY
ncbi:hypothetical protein Mp_1g12140 [Marchantia polymorpha subsp. ruderalis]|uniref:Uncharacterized protein n=2 Tax=Marchantia polymorpha TaxID=3197 RepID=A0AAF6APA1_MARPO|nr:hypothetical protein MARPO_0014s0011 [Marchantia polymorpha]PTQ45452.1 hypothetical protein MARPO_0014s0017 [Marchantia polymorpha]BBM98271.1 hypothetical protein Mp_1g12130 [Marchantia polymorpha subsp. ruderalis]BBM98272.1 hypothetical protein Mp_1g12140 [Marchantia polymorpha subsp. ruderalis]|eukprot:PTQ45446.1 hypothetical protein MARPO_0014s0011 [Marchantia polymorpha]